MEVKNRFIKAINYANFASVILLITQIPIYLNFTQRIAFIVAVFTYLAEFILEKKWKNFKWEGTKSQWFFVTLIFYFMLQFVYLPFEQNMSNFRIILDQRLVFLAIGIIGLFGFNKYFKLKYFAWAFVLTSTVLGLFLLGHLNLSLLMNKDRNSLLGLIRIYYINNHMMYNFYLNVSLVFCYYLFNKVRHKKATLTKWVLFIASSTILANLLLSDGRIGAVSGILILIIIAVHYLKGKRNFVIILSLSFMALVSSLIFLTNSRVSTENIKTEPRYKIWEVSLKELVNSKFIGEGASTATYNIDKALLSAGLNNKHAHNQLIQSTIEYGMLGTLSVLAIFITAVFSVRKQYRFLVFLIVLAAFAQLMVGTFMKDFYPITLLLPLLLINEQQKRNDLTSKPTF